MGQRTSIEWCDATWSPIIGCSKVSAGCDNCYAENIAARFAIQHKAGEFKGYYYDVLHFTDYEKWVWSGETARKQPKFNPLTARRPRTIFVCSMGDLFHESVPDEWIDEVLTAIATAHWHRYMILTKRPKRMMAYLLSEGVAYRWSKIWRDLVTEKYLGIREYPKLQEGMKPIDPKQPILPHVALGVSIEDQKTADERVPILLQTPAAKRFVSYEPALGPVDLMEHNRPFRFHQSPYGWPEWLRRNLDLVIMGGESGPHARPMHPDWARSMRDQCAAARVPFHFKRWGEWAPNCLCDTIKPHKTTDRPFGNRGVMFRCGKKAAGRLLDGFEHNGSINWGKKL